MNSYCSEWHARRNLHRQGKAFPPHRVSNLILAQMYHRPHQSKGLLTSDTTARSSLRQMSSFHLGISQSETQLDTQTLLTSKVMKTYNLSHCQGTTPASSSPTWAELKWSSQAHGQDVGGPRWGWSGPLSPASQGGTAQPQLVWELPLVYIVIRYKDLWLLHSSTESSHYQQVWETDFLMSWSV